MKKGYSIRVRQESESKYRQESEYQKVQYRGNPKSASARTQTRVKTRESESHITCNKSKLKHIRYYDTGGGVTEKKLNDQKTKTSRKYKYQTYRQHAGTPDTEMDRNRKQESRIKNAQMRNKNNQHK